MTGMYAMRKALLGRRPCCAATGRRILPILKQEAKPEA